MESISDGEIEYLEEDEEIVQQCVLSVQPVQVAVTSRPPVISPADLLVEVERPQPRKRRKRHNSSDYDPNEDIDPGEQPGRKKKNYPLRKQKLNSTHLETPQRGSKKAVIPTLDANELLANRKKSDIFIPDYDDPLCLPVRAIQQEDTDIKRLQNWNNVCLEHFKQCDGLLKPERGKTKSSNRTMVFRNIMNKQSGKVETTIWSKTCVENEDGDKKSEIFQCVLPRYKEKKLLAMYTLGNRKPKPFFRTDEVILSKEDHKDGEALVAYKPKEKLSAVYVNYDKNKASSKLKPTEEEYTNNGDDVKGYLKEVTCARMCAPCFHLSWRGVRKQRRKTLLCPVCARTCVTVYNLLAHLKTHAPREVRAFKRVISSVLAEFLEYHYKCRVCREQFGSIKGLKQHLKLHQGTESFTCEVGNHRTK